MKRGSTLLLKIAILLIGAGVLAFCIFALPAGIRAEDANGYRPLFIGMYFPAIPFFFALYQAFKLLNYIEKNNAFSDLFVKALKNIKYCAVSIGILYAAGMPLIFQAADKDDAPGVVAIALVIIFASFVVGTFAGVLQRLVQNAIDIKAENDLMV